MSPLSTMSAKITDSSYQESQDCQSTLQIGLVGALDILKTHNSTAIIQPEGASLKETRRANPSAVSTSHILASLEKRGCHSLKFLLLHQKVHCTVSVSNYLVGANHFTIDCFPPILNRMVAWEASRRRF